MPEKKYSIVMLIASIALVDAATDIYIPSLPGLVEYFDTDEKTISLSLYLGLIGFCTAAVIYGPLSDRVGRRPIMLLGMSVFVLGSIGAGLAQDIHFFLLMRLIQGFGTATPYVVGIAIINDLFREEKFSKIMSNIHMVVAISPAIAPIIGGYLDYYFGWQMSFLSVGGIVLVILLSLYTFPETFNVKTSHPFSLTHILFNYWCLLSNKTFIGYASISGIIFSGWWIYISTMPFIFHSLGIKVTEYGYYQAVLVFTYVIGTRLNNRYVERYGVDQLLFWSLIVSGIGSVSLVSIAYLSPQSSIGICATMAIFCLGTGGIFANTTTRAMEVFRNFKGSASAILGCIECLFPVAYLSLLSQFHEAVFTSAIGILMATGMALFVYTLLWLSHRPLSKPNKESGKTQQVA